MTELLQCKATCKCWRWKQFEWWTNTVMFVSLSPHPTKRTNSFVYVLIRSSRETLVFTQD